MEQEDLFWQDLLQDQNLDFFSALEILFDKGFKIYVIKPRGPLFLIPTIKKFRDFCIVNTYEIGEFSHKMDQILWCGTYYTVLKNDINYESYCRKNQKTK